MPSFCERARNSAPPSWASRPPSGGPSCAAPDGPASPSSSPATSSPSRARRSRPGRIYGSNGFALAAQVERAGAVVAGRATVPDDREGTRAAHRPGARRCGRRARLGRCLRRPARPRQAGAARPRRRGALLGRPAPARASPPGSGRVAVRSRSASPATPSRRWSPSSSSPARRSPRSRARAQSRARERPARRRPSRATLSASRRSGYGSFRATNGLDRRADEGRPGLARAHLDAGRRRPGVRSRPARASSPRASAWRSSSCEAARPPPAARAPSPRACARDDHPRAAVPQVGRERGHRQPPGGRGHAPQGGAREALGAGAPREPCAHLLELPVVLLARADPRAVQRRLARGRVPAPPVRAPALPQARVRVQSRRRDRHLADRPRRAGGEARTRARLPAPERAPEAGRARRPRGDRRRLLGGRELLPHDRHARRAAGSTSRPSCGST